MNAFAYTWLQDFFKTRAELKKDLETALENLEEGGCYDEANKLKKMDWNQLMKFKDL